MLWISTCQDWTDLMQQDAVTHCQAAPAMAEIVYFSQQELNWTLHSLHHVLLNKECFQSGWDGKKKSRAF